MVNLLISSQEQAISLYLLLNSRQYLFPSHNLSFYLFLKVILYLFISSSTACTNSFSLHRQHELSLYLSINSMHFFFNVFFLPTCIFYREASRPGTEPRLPLWKASTLAKSYSNSSHCLLFENLYTSFIITSITRTLSFFRI
jgi:hypothetical protein